MRTPEELMDSYFDGSITLEQGSELGDWIESSDEHAEAFLVRAMLHKNLRTVFTKEACLQMAIAELSEKISFADDSSQALSKRERAWPFRFYPRGTDASAARRVAPRLALQFLRRISLVIRGISQRSRTPVKIGVAGVLVTLIVGGFFLSGMLLDFTENRLGSETAQHHDHISAADDPSQDQFSESNDDRVAATLTGAIGCRWDPGFVVPRYGQHFTNDTLLSLEEGVAQLTFENGAKLVLSAPCKFCIIDAGKGALEFGQISAVVPKRASSFTVRTQAVEVVDLGTEFGVSTNEFGASEVHVFKGEVISRRLDSEGEPIGKAYHLVDQQAAGFSTGEREVREFAASEKLFVRDIETRLASINLPPMPVKRDLTMWLAADVLVKADSAGRVYAWQDILCADNQVADDALQAELLAQPRLVESAFHGKPALRFDGQSTFLVTTPLETTDDQTMIAVISIGDPLGQDEYHIIHYNGPPHRELHRLTFPGVLQLGLYRPSADSLFHVRGHAHVGLAESKENDGLKDVVTSGDVLSLRTLEYDKPTLVVYVYDSANNSASLYVNGQHSGVSTAPAPVGTISRKVIGRHGYQPVYFHGDISEVLLFNSALTSEEIGDVTTYLSSKYNISISSKPKSKQVQKP